MTGEMLPDGQDAGRVHTAHEGCPQAGHAMRVGAEGAIANHCVGAIREHIQDRCHVRGDADGT